MVSLNAKYKGKNKSNIISNHEYKFERLLKVGVSYRMNLLKKEDVLIFLQNEYSEEMINCTSKYWLDSSNALPWIIEPLFDEYPNAKFVYLTRDGKKVVSSFFNKLKEIMYPEWGVKEFKSFLESGDNEPKEDKRVWRPLPGYSKDLINLKPSSRFELICWYWAELSSEIMNRTELLPKENFYQLKFEDFIADVKCRDDLLSWLELDKKEFINIDLSRPVNVYEPKNYSFDLNQELVFKDICGNINYQLGYADTSKGLYEVKY